MKIIIAETTTKYYTYEIDDCYEQNLEEFNDEINKRKNYFDSGAEAFENVLDHHNISYDVLPECFTQSVESINIDYVIN